MLSKNHRLSSVILKNYKTKKGTYFVAKYAKNNSSVSRFAFIISKIIDNRAVVRNSLKRKLSISIQENFDKIVSGVDFVLIPNKKATEASLEDLKKDIKENL